MPDTSSQPTTDATRDTTAGVAAGARRRASIGAPEVPTMDEAEDAGAVAASHGERALRHWQRVRRLTGALLLVWVLASFGVVFHARELSDWLLLGTPLPFYMAAQGTILIYLAIIGIYALAMTRIEALSGLTRDDDDGR